MDTIEPEPARFAGGPAAVMTRKLIFSLSPPCPRLDGKGPEMDRSTSVENASEPDDIRLKYHFRGGVARLVGW
jgi:hypothetical protein